MILKQAASLGTMGRTVPQPRRGAFALEPVDALPRLADRIAALSERALEPNPFFLPEFLGPAIQALGGKGLKLATFSDRDDLRFFAPVVASGGGLLSGPKLRVWTHPFAPLGSPLIERDVAGQVADSLLKYLRTSERTLFSIPDLPLKGPVAKALRAAAERRGFWTEAACYQRPILNAEDEDGPAAFERMVSQRRRRELWRQLRRLCDTGSVSLMSARTTLEIDTAFNMFVALEASGWKGRRGTALQGRRAVRDFAHAAVMQMAQKGQAAIDVLRVGKIPVAALIRFEQAGLSVPWKIAYDETFAAFSPGKQLMCDETRRWLQDPWISRVDPVCEEGNRLISSLWPDQEPYGTLLLSTRRWGIVTRIRAGLMNMGSFGRNRAKALIGGRPRRAKPASVTRKAAPRDRSGRKA